MPGFEHQTGIHLTSSKIQLVELWYNDNQYRVENIDEAYCIEQINFEGDKEAKQLTFLQNAFDEILLRNKVKSEKISFTLPFDLFFSMQIPYDNTLVYRDLIEEFKWEFSILYPETPADQLVIQYYEIDKNHFIDIPSALVVAVIRKHLKLLSKFCNNNNFKLNFVDNPHFASNKALLLNNPHLHENLVLSIFITDKYLSISYLYNSNPIYYKLIPLVKASDISVIIKEETSPKNHFHINPGIITSAFISGDNISQAYIKTLNEITGIEFIGYNPFEKVPINQKLLENDNIKKRFHTFAAAAGIAYRLA